MRLFLFFLIFLPFVAKSQVDANFTVSATSGCVPLMVTITNNSTGSGSLTYTWNFGYGPPSSLEDPWPVNYLSPGNYTIVLTVTNGSQTDTQTQLIQVFAKPTAQFTFIGNTEGCIPLDVTFIDQSTPGSAPIVSWDWEFGNGDVSTQQGPQYTYTQPGVFGVLLQVTDTNGCTASVLIDPVVRGSNKPIVQFTADPTNHCIVPLDVQFTNSSNGTPPLSYQWDFGDGGTSASANPAHTYTTLGIYPVSLTVTDAYGCTADTVYTDFIDITGVTASFTTSTGFNTVCPGQAFQFLNTSGNSSVYWDFGTGATSTLEEPFMIYSNPGTYNVTLIAGYGMPCADTIVVPITVQNVQGAVNVTPPSGYSCQLPTTFNLSYNGTPVSSYDWQIETPGGTVTSSASAASAQITQNGSYPYSLVVSTQYGCTDTILDTLSIDAITTSITIVSAPEGCIPFDASFTCTTHSNEPVTNWDWDFGDGGTSNQESPNYTYLGSGTFQVSLTVTNSAGCTATATSEIKTGPHHYPNFEICELINPQVVDSCKHCPRDSIEFINLTTDTLYNPVDESDPNYEWTWFFGSTEFEPNELLDQYFATQDTGWQYDLWLICNYNGCRDTVHLDPDSLQLDSIGLYLWAPLIRSMSDSMSCDSTYKRWFFADIFEADHWDWDMGDGTQFLNSTEDTLIYTYTARGQYWVKLYAYNDSSSCVFKDSLQITITDIQASFTPLSDTICYGTTITLNGMGSQDANTYNWLVDSVAAGSGATPTLGPVNTTGMIPIQLIATDIFGCTDTLSSEIKVTRPDVDFVADTLFGCSPFSVQFISQATSEFGIQGWTWQYGDSQNSSGNDTVVHIYTPTPNIGVYTVQMQAVDSLGCSNAVSHQNYITVYAVEASLHYQDNYVCLGTQVNFFNWSQGAGMTFEWDFGNGASDTATNPSYFYPLAGVYTVQLIATDSVGCKDTVIKPNIIEIQEAIASFTVNATDTTCYPFQPIVTNLSPPNFGPVYEWNFGDGFVSSSQNPVHTYSLPGNYWLVYSITTSEGCTDKDSVSIHVGGPYANLTFTPDSICKGEEVFFTLTDTMNLQIINLNYGDAYGTNSINSSHIYTYVPTGGEFYVSLIYCSDSVCCKPGPLDTVNVEEVIAGFDIINNQTMLPDTSSCSPFTVQFPNTSFGATTWFWDFGNGQTFSGDSAPAINYTNITPFDSVYTITQIIQSDLGCTDTIRHDILVYSTPPLLLSNDTMICVGDSAHLTANGGDVIIWSPNTNISSSTSYTPSVAPGTSCFYYADIYDINGCTNRDSVYIYVQQEPTIIHSPDTSIIIGEYIQLFAASDQPGFTYIWTPDYNISDTLGSPLTAQPFETTTYTIYISDSVGCFDYVETVLVEVIENYSLDMPNVFSPNGDSENDKVYVRGWGLKQLVEFSIYNRWGERIYFSDDLLQGWDGTYNGKPQNIDTYTYYVKAITFADKVLEKKGNITIIR